MARGNFGERLKRERELREVSLKEVTVATRIGTRFLEALENEDWAKLPGGVFNRGFVRAIARYLGLDEESLLAEYDMARGEQTAELPAAPENRIPSPPKWMAGALALAALLVIAIVLAAGVYGWHRYSAYRKAKESAGVLAPLSGASGGGAVADPERASTLELSVSAAAVARVRVLADDKVVLDAEMRAGETRHFSAERTFEVTAAKPGAVLLQLNGEAMPFIEVAGTSGKIVLSEKNLRRSQGGNSQP